MKFILKLNKTLLQVCLAFFIYISMTANVAAQLSDVQRQEIEVAVNEVLDTFMETFNRLDIPAWEATFQFPHYRYASGNMNILDGPSERSSESLKKALGDEWHHSAWLRREVIHLSENKVHIDTQFARYRENSSVIAAYDSLYILTKENNRWGIKLRSSMAP